MGINAKFNVKDVVEQMVSEEAAKVHAKIFENLAYVGDEAIKLAREKGSYTDQTGNLRASTGYVISYNGKIISDAGFDPNAAGKTKKQRDGQTGASGGKTFAYEMAGKHKNGFVLIVVAGMYYGAYVEKRQYDVLTFTEAQARIVAEKLFGQMFKAA